MTYFQSLKYTSTKVEKEVPQELSRLINGIKKEELLEKIQPE